MRAYGLKWLFTPLPICLPLENLLWTTYPFFLSFFTVYTVRTVTYICQLNFLLLLWMQCYLHWNPVYKDLHMKNVCPYHPPMPNLSLVCHPFGLHNLDKMGVVVRLFGVNLKWVACPTCQSISTSTRANQATSQPSFLVLGLFSKELLKYAPAGMLSKNGSLVWRRSWWSWAITSQRQLLWRWAITF